MQPIELFNETVASIVIDVRDVVPLKNVLIEAIRGCHTDQRWYIYHPDHDEIPRWVGKSVFQLANYQDYYDFDINHGIRKSLCLMQNESEDLKKYLFIISDRFEPKHQYRFEKSLLFNEKERINAKICFFSELDYEAIREEIQKIGKVVYEDGN